MLPSKRSAIAGAGRRAAPQARRVASEMRAHARSPPACRDGSMSAAVGQAHHRKRVVGAHEARDERAIRGDGRPPRARPNCTMRPASITAMRSASISASSRSCVTYTAVMPMRRCKRAQLVPKLEAHLVVEIRHRLVEEQQMRVDRERASERDALALAAGELRHRALGEAFELQELQHLRDALVDRVALPAAHAQAVADVARDGHVRPQRIGLEHHRGRALLRRQVGDVLARDLDAALVGHHEARDRAQERGLAAARSCRAARSSRRARRRGSRDRARGCRRTRRKGSRSKDRASDACGVRTAGLRVCPRIVTGSCCGATERG